SRNPCPIKWPSSRRSSRARNSGWPWQASSRNAARSSCVGHFSDCSKSVSCWFWSSFMTKEDARPLQSQALFLHAPFGKKDDHEFARSQRRLQLRVKPGTGKSPMTSDGRLCQAQGSGDFLMIHADEITELHNPGFQRVLCREFVERFMHGEHSVI